MVLLLTDFKSLRVQGGVGSLFGKDSKRRLATPYGLVRSHLVHWAMSSLNLKEYMEGQKMTEVEVK